MNAIEAAALRALKPYYMAHWDARRNDAAGLTGLCECEPCRHARYFFEMLGVNPAMFLLAGAEEGVREPRLSA